MEPRNALFTAVSACKLNCNSDTTNSSTRNVATLSSLKNARSTTQSCPVVSCTLIEGDATRDRASVAALSGSVERMNRTLTTESLEITSWSNRASSSEASVKPDLTVDIPSVFFITWCSSGNSTESLGRVLFLLSPTTLITKVRVLSEIEVAAA